MTAVSNWHIHAHVKSAVPGWRLCACGDIARAEKPALAQEHSATSVAAARAIEPTRTKLQTVVYRAIRDAVDGLTDEEGIALTGMSPSTYRPRRVELVEANRISDSRRTRPTKSGRRAVVWVAA